jgi:hypothetical protein
MGDEWTAEKQRLVASGENPSATVPVMVVLPNEEDKNNNNNNNNNVAAPTSILPQHIATSRLLAKVYDSTSGDTYKDYIQDLVADEYQGFRDRWVAVSFSASDEEKEIYRKDELHKLLTKFDGLYQQFKTHDVFLSISPKTNNPLWGDAAMFGLLRDHIITGHTTLDALKASYPYLSNMYEKYEKIPLVAKWINGVEAVVANS